jgi:gluconate 2-dehydrogenase gamma chain
MNRRELLGLLGNAAVAPMLVQLPPEVRLAVGRALHARLPAAHLRCLDVHQHRTVTLIAELILPETDTPGATTVGVPEFIDLLLAEWYPPAECDSFLAGLEDIDTRSRQAHGGVLLDLRPADRTAVLDSLDGAKGVPGSAEAAFATLKRLTLYGYFTSERVMKDVIRYQVIPGRHDGCVPV